MEYNTYYLFCKSIGRGTFFSAPNYEEFVEKIRKNGEGESSSSGCRLYSIMRNDVTPDNILSRIKGNDGVYLQGQSCSEAFFFDASFGGFCFPLKPVVTFSENRRIPLALAMGMKGGSREFAQAMEAGRFATVTGSFC